MSSITAKQLPKPRIHELKTKWLHIEYTEVPHRGNVIEQLFSEVFESENVLDR